MGGSRSRSPRRDSRSPPRRGGGSPPRRGYSRSPRRGGGYRSPPRGGREGKEREQERARSNQDRISLLVRNISDRTDSRDLREYFERYGHVKDVYIPTDFYTRRPKPFAFVEFTNIDHAHDAKDDMDRREFQGRIIEVVFAQQKRKSPGEMRNRDGPPPRRYSRSPRRRDSRSPPRRRDSPPTRRERSRDRDSPRRDDRGDDRGRGRDD